MAAIIISDAGPVPTINVAGRAATLSTDLYAVGERCEHESTASEISSIAGELAHLSTTLWRLHDAMLTNGQSFTALFRQDLDEITTELNLLFDEVAECCVEMQRADSGTNAVAIRFFKKNRLLKLQKHLEALKTTLVVMRTVLHHGKEYGSQK